MNMRARWRSCRICEISRPGLTAPKSDRSRLPARRDGGSDVVGRLPQQPLAGVLPQRNRPDGVLRQRRHRREQVGGQGLRQRDAQGTRDDGERQRLVAGGAAGTHQLPVLRQLRGREDLGADLQQPGAHLDAGLAQLPGQQLGGQQRIQFSDGNVLIEEPDGQRVRIGQLLAHKGGQPHPERRLITDQPALDVALKPQRVSKRPGRQRRITSAAAGPAGRTRG